MPVSLPRRHPAAVLLAALPLVLAVAGCGGGDPGDWPQLLPGEALLAEPAAAAARPEAQSPATATDPLLAQANALRDRAEAMRRSPVIDPLLLARMRAAGT